MALMQTPREYHCPVTAGPARRGIGNGRGVRQRAGPEERRILLAALTI